MVDESIATLKPLQILMRACRIQSRVVEVHIADLDARAFLETLQVSAEDFGGLVKHRGYPHWWEWSTDELSTDEHPSWWSNPDRAVVMKNLIYKDTRF